MTDPQIGEESQKTAPLRRLEPCHHNPTTVP